MGTGMLIISGCPRSGTSVHMDIQRAVHGESAILGMRFPQEARKESRQRLLERQEHEPMHVWQVRNYLMEKRLAEEEARMSPAERDFRDLNPDGFWEMAFTVKGIIYQPAYRQELADVLAGKFKIVKVVSQGLLASDPQYIGKIIYSLRHPRAVAKSQERLVRGFMYKDQNGQARNAFENLVIHTPEMFIAVTQQAASFLLMHPSIPIRFYHFEELIQDPVRMLADMQQFVGRGDYTKAHDVVKPSLNRSQPEEVANDLWEDAEFVYQRFSQAASIINEYAGDDPDQVAGQRQEAEPYLRELLEYLADPGRNFNRQKKNWRCYRARRQVQESMCRECVKRGQVMHNLRAHSEQTKSELGVTKPWREEPCLFECGLDPDRTDYLTVEESIKHNFWLDSVISGGLSDGD